MLGRIKAILLGKPKARFSRNQPWLHGALTPRRPRGRRELREIKPKIKLNFGRFPQDWSNLLICAQAIIPAWGFLGLGANLDVIPEPLVRSSRGLGVI